MALLQWLRRLRQQPTIKEHAGGKHSTGLRTGRPRGERDDLQAAATWQPVDSDWLSESVVSRDVTSRRHVTWRHGVIDVDATERYVVSVYHAVIRQPNHSTPTCFCQLSTISLLSQTPRMSARLARHSRQYRPRSWHILVFTQSGVAAKTISGFFGHFREFCVLALWRSKCKSNQINFISGKKRGNGNLGTV